MTEREKMMAGLMYDANNDEELCRERVLSQDRCLAYNMIPASQSERKAELLNEILGSHGKNTKIQSPFMCDYGYNIHVGDNFFANYNFVVLDGAEVLIGDNVFIAPNVGIYTAGHPIDALRRNKGLEYAKPVTIGNDVWIGAGVQILPGVTIGNGCVIGAGSVVVKDIPDNTVAVGNPCKVVKSI